MSRVRSKVVNYPMPTSIVLKYPDGTILTKNGSDLNAQTHSMTDEKTIGYFGKSRKGQFLPINPLSQSKKEILSNFGSVSWDRKASGVHQYDLVITGPVAYCQRAENGSRLWPAFGGSTVPWPDGNASLIASLANARTRGFDVLTFLAEFHKTIELITRFRDRTLTRARKVADSISRREPDPVSAFAETWLESRYGWRLLIYDINSINRSLTRLNSTRAPYVRGYDTRTNSGIWNLYNYTTPTQALRYVALNGPLGDDWGWVTGRTDQTLSRTVHTGTVIEALLSDLLTIDPLVTTWEVIPFSFIIDWFTNVGDIITAYSPFAMENVLGGWITSKEVLSTKSVFQTCNSTGASPGYVLYGPSQSCYLETISTTTTRVSSSPSASLSFRVNLDGLKLADLSSIFITRWGGILGDLLKHNRI